MSTPQQTELRLPYSAIDSELPFLPARMINEFEYCPRLAYLVWVQCEWAESADTVRGSHRHWRVNRGGGTLPPADELDEACRVHARSVTLSSARLGLIARIDLVEATDGRIRPVEYKRGKRPHVEKGAYSPERVQVCVQGMLFREHGYDCDEGVLYFVESRERVRVVFDDELLRATERAIDGLRLMAAGGRMPAPLEDSPKCPRCSLVSICLPDETNFLRENEQVPRAIAVPVESALPRYVQARGGKVAKSGENLVVSLDDKKVVSARIAETSQVVVMGGIHITTPWLQELMWREIPVTWHSAGGWFYGHTLGTGHKNVEVRTAQYRRSFDDGTCARIARGLVRAKILNSRTFLRRNWKSREDAGDVCKHLKNDAERAARAIDTDSPLGSEGTAAARYFKAFPAMLTHSDDPATSRFDFSKRNRRPPGDPVNAMLSLAYSLLVRTWTVALVGGCEEARIDGEHGDRRAIARGRASVAGPGRSRRPSGGARAR